VIRDDNSRLLALVGGSGDLTQNTVSPLLLDAVVEQPRLKVESGRSAVFTYLGLNCDDPILGDPRVRRAIAYAIDRKTIVDTKYRGRAVLATGMLPTLHWAYNKDVDQYPYDPARARQLLDEAGHPDPDGAGPRPRFTLVYKTSSVRFRVALAQVIAAELAEVGIEVELRPLEFATFFADVKKGNFQLFSMQVPEIAEPDLYTNFYHSSRIPTRENPDRGGNRARYRDADVDRLIDEGRGVVDRPRRTAIYGEVQRILARDLPVIPLWHEDNVAVMGRQVEGFRILPTGQFSSLARARKAPR
jgi:peptide/nickel transport system substrate-binding protein